VVGRHVFGLASILFGIVALTFHGFNDWQQVRPLGAIPHREILLCVIAAVEILGGIAIQFRKTARAGAAALGVVFLFFAVLWLPLYFEKPSVFDRLANFFEQFSLVAGALIIVGAARIGYVCFGVCVISFTVEQIVYLHGTADFVPKWIPPGQMFWAVLTTIAFALASIALLSGRSALLASRLLTAMIVGFGLLVWLPAVITHPHSLLAWAGNAQNGAIAGAAWIVADYLARDGKAMQS
jgi:uncharacterized membrane protein YphA (DoxX/SURF4 family)